MHDSRESRGLDSLTRGLDSPTRGLGTSRGLGSALTCLVHARLAGQQRFR